MCGGFRDRAGIRYEAFPDLGGRRDPRPDSVNLAWRNPSFRGYADYMETEEFRVAIERLSAMARTQRTAVMCAEAVWWRCHRRIVADYLLVGGVEVRHIMDHGKIEPATLTPGAEPQADGTILYPAAQGVLI